MKIVWDERKRLSNLVKHGWDFETILDFEWDGAVFGAAHESRLGQKRLKATGLLAGKVVVVIFSALGTEAISIISLRAASLRERAEFRWSSSVRR